MLQQISHIKTMNHPINKHPTRRILIVDDDETLTEFHEAILTFAGYDTENAANGEDALVMLATGRFDLVVTDRTMPRLDGCGLIRALRKAGSRIPVMMISACVGIDELPDDVCREIAVALPKPAPISGVLAAVAYALHEQAAPAKEHLPRRPRVELEEVGCA